MFDKKKIYRKSPAVKFVQFLVIKTMDLNPQLEKMLGPDPYPDPH
jgi:hypothetical protein